jgi:2-polyprenyl-3-methyl-5-hydroxy-6-metoxy-1,4-benzoquinol methylase
MTKPIVERHELSLYGIKTIMRHDYADPEIMGKIRSYIDKSIKALDDFLTNVPGSEKFKSFCDVGCGEDYVVEKMSKKFSEFFGLDLHIKSDRRYAGGPRTGIYKEDWYEMADTFGQTDVIFINHSMEHAANAFALMEQLSKMQNRGNVLFVAVPDADYPWAYSMTSSTTHFSIFNEGFLQEILQRYGYRVCVEKRCFREGAGELWAFCVKQVDGLPE